MKSPLVAATVLAVAFSQATFAQAQKKSLVQIEQAGTRDGKTYASDLRRHGIVPDGTACAIGMAAADELHAQYTQIEAEAYAAAFGNACVGRKTL